MEPADLNPRPDDPRLVALLQQTSAPLADDGFSDRVLAALPPPHRAAPRFSSWLAVLVGAVAGLTYARGQGATPGELHAAVRGVETLLRQAAPLLDSPWVWLMGAVVVVSCYSALRLAGLARTPFLH